MHPTLILTALALIMVSAAGRTDLEPLQAEVDSPRTQVGNMKTEVSAHIADKSDSPAAAKAPADATAAGKAPAAAQATANQVLFAAQAAQAAVDATNENIGRMSTKSVST